MTISQEGPRGTVNPGVTKCYQDWFRNPPGGFCGAGTFNLSNAVLVTWW